MRLFSDLFKQKPKPIVNTPLGVFTLVYSKGAKNSWSNNSTDVLLSLRGSATTPDAEQLAFLETWQQAVSRLDDEITRRFVIEFSEAGLPVNFKRRSDRFRIVAVEVMLLFRNQPPWWSITFEDLEDPYAHFTLYIEGEKLTGFSIDTR